MARNGSRNANVLDRRIGQPGEPAFMSSGRPAESGAALHLGAAPLSLRTDPDVWVSLLKEHLDLEVVMAIDHSPIPERFGQFNDLSPSAVHVSALNLLYQHGDLVWGFLHDHDKLGHTGTDLEGELLLVGHHVAANHVNGGE